MGKLPKKGHILEMTSSTVLSNKINKPMTLFLWQHFFPLKFDVRMTIFSFPNKIIYPSTQDNSYYNFHQHFKKNLWLSSIANELYCFNKSFNKFAFAFASLGHLSFYGWHPRIDVLHETIDSKEHPKVSKGYFKYFWL